MKLTEQQQQALMQEIADDLPEDYTLLPPWISVYLAQFVCHMLASGLTLSLILLYLLQLKINTATSYTGSLISIMLILLGPHFLILNGSAKSGIRLIRLSVLLLSTITAAATLIPETRIFPLIIPVFILDVLAAWITTTVRFKAFCLHRQKTMTWSRARIRKNREFKERIKQVKEASED